MKKIEAVTLEDALIIAGKEFNCSVVDLEYEIIQNPSSGFLGFGKKPAIICVQKKIEKLKIPAKAESLAQDFKQQVESKEAQIMESKEFLESDFKQIQTNIATDSKPLISSDFKKNKKALYSKDELENIAKTAQAELQNMLDFLPYKLDKVLISVYDENTLFIKIDGEDSALLIGKEGYRYKAISYLIFNWINQAYGLMIRLEVAEFLKNQEEMIANYLQPTIETIKTLGKAQTKPLDGVLAHIALKQLREMFPDKYVSFRLNADGERYIVINEFYY